MKTIHGNNVELTAAELASRKHMYGCKCGDCVSREMKVFELKAPTVTQPLIDGSSYTIDASGGWYPGYGLVHPFTIVA